MSQYKEYFKYRDTNQPWMEVIPRDWDFLRAKYIFLNSTYKSSEDLVQLAASQKYGVIPQKDLMEKSNRVVQALKGTDGFKEVNPGDFVISLRSFEGGIESSDYHGCISPAYTVLRNRNPYVFDKDFYRYFLKCSIFVQKLNSSSEGIRDGKTITYDQFREIVLPVPKYSEQTAIATFLDRETSRIDRLIDAKKRFIERLKEKRQALISHAVTKGLDPNAPMKDSGVEWIGEIPEGWGVIPLSMAINYQEGPGIMASDFKDKGIPLIRISGVQESEVSLDGCNYLDPDKVEAKWSHFKLQRGSLLISASASMGNVATVGEQAKGAIPYTGLIQLSPASKLITASYIKFIIMSDVFLEQIKLMKSGSTIQHFGPTHLSKMKVVLPPLEDQYQIVGYLNSGVDNVDKLICKTLGSIKVLKEKRTALITAAVTGKIDVRDEV